MNDGLKNDDGLKKDDELNLFPSKGPIPQEGIPKIKQAIEYNKHMELKRKAQIEGKKKAVKTKSVSPKVVVATIIGSIVFLASPFIYNDAKADLIYDNLRNSGYSEVASVDWFDGFHAYDENGRRVSIEQEDSNDASPNFKEVIQEIFQNNIRQGRGGR